MHSRRYIFRRERRWYSSPLAIFILLSLILSGLLVNQSYNRQEIKPLFLPTSTPTRIPISYASEAETHFQAGNLDAAIASYQEAITIDPQNGRLYAELARILTYSTESQTTDKEKETRFKQALEAADQAAKVAPDDSTAHAVRAFTLDWYAGFTSYIQQKKDEGAKMLGDAEQAIARATTLDETNVLAQVYFAEIMIDTQRWDQAQSAIQKALQTQPDLWEAHRVKALFLENQGYYMEAIKEFEEAARLAPNMTFLYIKLGQSYRNLGLKTGSRPYYEQAINYFDLVAKKNEQLGIQDPLPYLGIGRAYGQLGEFFIASRNMNKALQYNPYNPDVYAQLGMVYRQARNYEDAIAALKCAIRGCNADETCAVRQCNVDTDLQITIEGMDLSAATVVYYYTYASLLAGMYLPRHPVRAQYCVQALDVIDQISSSPFGSDTSIMEILAPSKSICLSASASPTDDVTTLTPQVTLSPGPTPTPTQVK
jgi:tetratricopeptide (TPR) repeat protein